MFLYISAICSYLAYLYRILHFLSWIAEDARLLLGSPMSKAAASVSMCGGRLVSTALFWAFLIVKAVFAASSPLNTSNVITFLTDGLPSDGFEMHSIGDDLVQLCTRDCRISLKMLDDHMCCRFSGLINVHRVVRAASRFSTADVLADGRGSMAPTRNHAHLAQFKLGDDGGASKWLEAQLLLLLGSETFRYYARNLLAAPARGYLFRPLRQQPGLHPQLSLLIAPDLFQSGCFLTGSTMPYSECAVPGVSGIDAAGAALLRLWQQELLQAAVRAQQSWKLSAQRPLPAGHNAGTAVGTRQQLTHGVLEQEPRAGRSQDRSLYLRPQASRGVRNILVARFRYYQQADSDVLNDADANVLVTQSLSHLNNLSFGAARWTYTLPTRVYSFPSTMFLCSSTLTTMQTESRSALLAKGVDPSQYAALLVLLPQCQQTSGGQEEGVASLGSFTSFLFAANFGAHRALLSVFSFSLGIQTADFVDPITSTYAAGGNELDSAGLGGVAGMRTWNNFSARAFHSGYAVDAGWIPEDRVVTLGTSALVAHATLLLCAMLSSASCLRDAITAQLLPMSCCNCPDACAFFSSVHTEISLMLCCCRPSVRVWRCAGRRLAAAGRCGIRLSAAQCRLCIVSSRAGTAQLQLRRGRCVFLPYVPPEQRLCKRDGCRRFRSALLRVRRRQLRDRRVPRDGRFSRHQPRCRPGVRTTDYGGRQSIPARKRRSREDGTGQRRRCG